MTDEKSAQETDKESGPVGLAADGPLSTEEGSHPEALFEQIDLGLRDELLAMEIAPIRAEKALYYTQSKSLNSALIWLSEHQDEEDIDVPIPASAVKPKLSQEEAKKKAEELQRKAKEKRIAREKQEAIESEVKRMEYSKKLQSAAREQEESETKKWAEQQRKEKEEHAAETRRSIEKLRLEWIEKHGTSEGCPYNTQTEETPETVKKKSKKDQVIFWINRMVASYKESDNQGLIRCLKRLKGIFENIRNDPVQLKYQKLRKTTNVFSLEIEPFSGAKEIMIAVGFEELGDFMEMTGAVDGFLLHQINNLLDITVSKL